MNTLEVVEYDEVFIDLDTLEKEAIQGSDTMS